MQLKNECHVLVCDGGKYLLLQNTGDEDIMNLQVVDHLEVEHGPSSAIGRARPGEFQADETRRGRGDTVEPHDQAKERFVLDVVQKLEDQHQSGVLKHMVVIADQRSLGCLRAHMSDALQTTLIAEIAADHAHRTVAAIENALTRVDLNR